MKPKTMRQIFDELGSHVSPEHQASWERLGRSLERLQPDDEILQIVWFLIMHTDIGVNALKNVVQMLIRLQADLKSNRNQMSDLEKWMKILFWVFIGQTIVLGLLVSLFEAAMVQIIHP